MNAIPGSRRCICTGGAIIGLHLIVLPAHAKGDIDRFVQIAVGSPNIIVIGHTASGILRGARSSEPYHGKINGRNQHILGAAVGKRERNAPCIILIITHIGIRRKYGGRNSAVSQQVIARNIFAEIIGANRGGSGESRIGVRTHSDGIQGSPGPVKRSGAQHRGLGSRRAKSQGRNDYQCFLHNWGRLNGVNLFRLADYKSEVNTKR